MGAVHAAAWARIDDVELAAIVGRRPSRARDLAARFDVPAFTDVAAVLDDSSIAAVDLAVPTSLHRDLAIAALACGKHVLCETPLAPSVADVDAMVETARRAGRRLQVAQLVRLAEPNVEVRALLRAGAFGRPLVVSCQRLWPGLDALDDPADHHGDALDEVALFDLDWLLWCFGLPDAVTAHASATSGARVDHVLVVLEIGRVRAFVEASVRLPASFPFRLATRVVCEDGTVEWSVRFTAAGPPEVIVGRHPRRGPPQIRAPRGRDPYLAECRHFAEVVRGRADPELLDPAGARDGLRILAAARASLAAGGARVPVEVV
jgi:UDP-N-acetylglucosamine 3-dehydrogenase